MYTVSYLDTVCSLFRVKTQEGGRNNNGRNRQGLRIHREAPVEIADAAQLVLHHHREKGPGAVNSGATSFAGWWLGHPSEK